MPLKQTVTRAVNGLRFGAVTVAMLQMTLGDALQAQQAPPQARTPIQHVIVIIGENRTFDHVFATYQAKNGQHVDNLLTKGIIKPDGTPGPFYFLAAQYSADVTNSPIF